MNPLCPLNKKELVRTNFHISEYLGRQDCENRGPFQELLENIETLNHVVLLSMEPWAAAKKTFSQCGGATSSCPGS